MTTWIDAARIEATWIGRRAERGGEIRPPDRAARSVRRSRRAAAILDQWRIGGARSARPARLVRKGSARLVVVWRPKDGRVARARFWLFEHWRFRESGEPDLTFSCWRKSDEPDLTFLRDASPIYRTCDDWRYRKSPTLPQCRRRQRRAWRWPTNPRQGGVARKYF